MSEQPFEVRETAREIVRYEYKIETTPRYIVEDENWVIYDVLLKTLPNGYSTFVVVFRRELKKNEK